MEAGPGVEPRWTDLQSAAWPLCQPAIQTILLFERVGASNEVRTRDLDLGKVALYQLSYTRINLVIYSLRVMVPGAGLEPARPFERGILNPLCLPISPPGQTTLLCNYFYV